MPRPTSTDFLHNMRFHVIVDAPNSSLLGDGAGFSACSTPESTVDAVEYREGHYVYTRKQPGLPTMADITMSRGVTKADSAFWAWMKSTMEGSSNYRVDLLIQHFHRDAQVYGSQEIPLNATPGKMYHVHEAFPVRHKVAGDLDGTASDISIMELDVSYEWFEIKDDGAQDVAASAPAITAP